MSAILRAQQVLPASKSQIPLGFRVAIGALGTLFVLLAALYIKEFAADPARFPVMNVDVNGTLDYTDRDSLRERIELHTQHGFYGLDVEAIRDGVESLPWVATAHVRRIWPGRLMVSVEEHEPAARFNDDSLISKSMELFKPPQLQPDNPQFSEWRRNFAPLPKLSGADGRHEFVLDAYRQYELVLSQFGVKLVALVEDERRSQTLELDNQITVRLGYEAHEFRLQRFVDIYDRLVTPLNGTPAKFDMRYSNGFAMSTGGLIGGSN